MISASKIEQLALGKVVAALRKRQGMSQEIFAQAIGVSQPTISRLERGTLRIDHDLYVRIAAILGKTETELDHDVRMVVQRTQRAAAAAMQTTPDGDPLSTALKVVGLVGLGALVAFTVAALIDELSDGRG